MSVPIAPSAADELEQGHGRVDVVRVPGPLGGGVVHVGDPRAVYAGPINFALSEQDASRLEVGVCRKDRFGDALGQRVKTPAIEGTAQGACGEMMMVSAQGTVRVGTSEHEVGVPVTVARLRRSRSSTASLACVREGQVAGHEGHPRLIGGVGDDECTGVLPLVQPFGNLIGADEPQHRHADHRKGDVRDRPADEIGFVGGAGRTGEGQAAQGSPTRQHVTVFLGPLGTGYHNRR